MSTERPVTLVMVRHSGLSEILKIMKGEKQRKRPINRTHSQEKIQQRKFNEPIVRTFTMDDLKSVMDICASSLSEKYSESLFQEIFLNWPDGFLVGVVNGEIVGFIAGRKASRSDARILMLAVEEEVRSMGIGAALMKKFTEHSCSYGIINLRLEVRTDNQRGIDFYRKLGFIVSSIMRNYYSDGSDAYLMWKQLI